MTLGERILAFISHKGITPHKFETICGLTNGYVRSIKDEIGSQKLLKILTVYPELSATWLLFETGPMLVENANPSSQNEKISNFQSGLNSFSAIQSSSEISSLVSILKDQMKQNERLIAMLEHIVFQGDKQSNAKQ